MTDTWKLTTRELLIAYGEGMRDFSGANLYGANLSRANLPDNFHVLQFGPVGSRKSYTVATVYPDDVHEIRTGCFRGSLEEFIAAVQKKPEGDPFRAEYENIVIPGIRWFFEQHKVKVAQS